MGFFDVDSRSKALGNKLPLRFMPFRFLQPIGLSFLLAHYIAERYGVSRTTLYKRVGVVQPLK